MFVSVKVSVTVIVRLDKSCNCALIHGELQKLQLLFIYFVLTCYISLWKSLL